ncbi:ubiquitin-binding serine/threonine protein kinase [Martiniozyma asiatica (nom. inval.)]|nr:ubiquitin-binding serine/threonine protein kinase [Martiniozyma asiatica]
MSYSTADLSLISPTAQTIAVSAYIDFLPHIQYSKPLGTARFLKTIKCLSHSGSVIVKLLIKPNNLEIDLLEPLKKNEYIRSKILDIPNVLPFEDIIDSDRACYLIRPFIRYNLNERISIRPFLEDIEKKWIVYQLLHALSKIHEHNICHGDIKPENVLLTSWLWAYLSDFATLKPVYLPDYNQSQFSFYFESQRHACYVAPERFRSINELNNNKDNNLKPEMDIFSLGCVIAELYTDGIPLFSLPQLFKYKKGEYTPNLDGIENIKVRELVKSMISLDVSDRLTAKEYLVNFRKSIFPDHFYTFLHTYVKNLNMADRTEDKFVLCNQRIEKIWQDFDKIALYLGFKGKIADIDSQRSNDCSGSIIPVELNLPGMYRHIPQPTSKIFTEANKNDCSSLILLGVVMYNVRNTTHSSFRMKACDLILAFSEQLHDEAKLDRCLPYLANMLDDPSENLQSVALKSLTQLLTMVEVITVINVYLFQEYLLPKLQLLLRRSYLDLSKDSISTNLRIFDNSNSTLSDPYNEGHFKGVFVRMVFASCLPYLAMAAKKFYHISQLLKNQLPTFHDPDFDGTLSFTSNDQFDFDFCDVEDQFEQLTIQILTDTDSSIRIAVMKNILPLCSFFGKDKSNDVILSHLITYLNDKNPQIKLVFVKCIIPLSIFVGPTSLELYIMPLLMQTLYDPDELITVELLHVLRELVSIGMLKKKSFWDITTLTIKLCLHPNEFIRDAVINLIVSIGDKLSLAELYCMLYPLIRPYFKHELTEFNWNNLFISVHEPIDRSIYTMAKRWSIIRDGSLFWQKVTTNGKTQMDAFGNTQISFLKRNRGSNANNSKGISTTVAVNDVISNNEVPLSKDDKQQIDQLLAIGFDQNDLWKIATLRSYIYKVSKFEGRSLNIKKGLTIGASLPRSVFVDVKYDFSSETNKKISTKKIELENSLLGANLIASGKDIEHKTKEVVKTTTNISKSPMLILSSLHQTKPYIGENKTTAFGESSSLFSGILGGNQMNKHFYEDIGDSNVYDETLNFKSLTTNVTHTYPGHNPFILKFLESVKFEPDLDIYKEFGNAVPKLLHNDKNNEPSSKDGYCVLVDTLFEHDCTITCLEVSPDHRYFITGDEKGYFKIWESSRLELDVTGTSSLSANIGSSIKCMTFIENRNVVAVSMSDGQIKMFRIDFVDSLNKNPMIKNQQTSISLIRHLKLKKSDGFVTCMKFSVLKETPYLYLVSSTGKILVYDIRTMTEKKRLNNNVRHGIPFSMAVDANQSWLLIGTSKGVLDLWDIDSKLCVRSIKFKNTSFPIYKIENVKVESNEENTPYVSLIGGTGESDVTILDVRRMQPRMILCSKNVNTASTIELYSVKNINDEIETNFLDLWYDLDSFENDKSSSSLCLGWSRHGPSIISATSSRKIIEWNMSDVKNSRVIVDSVSDGYIGKKPVYVATQISSSLTFVHERYTDNGTSKKKIINKCPMDKVTALGWLSYPSSMVISADRSGIIRIYK